MTLFPMVGYTSQYMYKYTDVEEEDVFFHDYSPLSQ